MIRCFYILLISISLPVFVSGQSLRCMYDELTVKACQEKDFVKAKAYSDSTLSKCPDLFENPYVWYLRGVTLYQLYKQQGAYSDSPLREDALEALNRSIQLDSVEHQFEADVKGIIKNIATSYWNNAAVSMDTNSFNRAIEYYGKYKRTIKIALPDFDLSEREMEFKMALGELYEEKYYNNMKLYAEYIDLALNCYQEVLTVDSMHYNANLNIGKVYHNLAVEIIINEIPHVDDLELFFMFEEQTVEYFSYALPYFKKAYSIQPQNKLVIQGLAAVYYSLHDEEKHKIYMNVLKEIQQGEMEQQNIDNAVSSWDANTTYSAGDVVEFSGSFYKAITTSIGVSPNSSATDWEKL